MLSVNSTSTNLTTGVMAFKGKPSAKELKKFYQLLEKQRIDMFLKNPNISKAEKQEFLIRETAGNIINTIKKFIKL